MKMKGKRRAVAAACFAIAACVASTCGLAWAASGVGIAKGEVLIKNTATTLAPGVVEREVVSNTPAGNDQKIDYLCEVDLQGTSTTKVVAGYGSAYSTDSWELSATTAQAAGYEKKTGETVVAAINADFFNMATGEPMGALVMDGQVKHGANGRNYFAVLKDGTAVVRDASVPLDDCQTAVGGDALLIKDGIVNNEASEYGELDYSRTAIGIKADGTVVTFATHGRLYPVSCGRTYQEMAELLLDAGCVQALALDGGGSSTFAARPEGTPGLVVRNSPSDGAEREVSSTILIVSTAKPTGEFDHASLEPNNEVYTPGSTVQFAAHGADGSGAAVDLPDGLAWRLAAGSESLGSVDATTGLFSANDKEGVVEVELVRGDEVVGATSIEVAKPDQILFASDEVSLGFEEQTDFGLQLKNEGRDINFKEGDVIWTMTDSRLGTFAGNQFTSSDGETLNGDVTATSRFDGGVSGTLHVIVGLLPTLVWDFEDRVDEATGEKTPASDYYVGSADAPGILTHSNYGRGGKESVEIVSIDDDEPVRFGSHALKLNFDFTECGEVTEGACVGTTESMAIPGTPTGIGVWVYAPEGVGVEWQGPGTQAGFWLRGYVRDAAGNNMPYDFTLEPKSCTGDQRPGIYWEGWQYLEADLTSMKAPFSVQPGMTFRLMYVAGTQMGTKTAGSLYFDNLQFVYGTNIDDVDEPVIESIMANGELLEDGAVLADNTVTFDAMFHDVENKYTSGIDGDTIRMHIDGVNVADNERFSYVVDPDATRSHVYDVKLPNGSHALTVSLRDEFGNETSRTVRFTVEGEGIAGAPDMAVAPREDAAVLGESVTLDLTASNAAGLSEATASLKLGRQFGDCQVTFAPGFEGTATYKKLTGVLSIEARRTSGEQDAGGVVASVSAKVPSSLSNAASFTYEVKAGSVLVGDAFYTFSAPEEALPLSAAFAVSADPIIVGSDGVIKVVDAHGMPAAGVTIMQVLEAGEEEVGITNAEGLLKTACFSEEAGDYVVYAVKDGRLSFRCTVSSYAAQAAGDIAPFAIMNHATTDPSTEKSITWLTSLSAPAQSIQYAYGDGGWETLAAEAQTRTFTKGGNSAVVANGAILTGLAPGTTYRYRVGGEESWSDEMTFTTNAAGEGSSFFLLGDIQSEDMTNVNALMDQIRTKDFDFGIQTGDAVDDATSYEDWADIASLFGAKSLADTDMVHVMGNHEYAGDADGLTAAALYNLPASGPGESYSVTYGNVYVAVINYAGNSVQLAAALDWLEQDAAASKATWKVLAIHQPAYYTNVAGGNAEVHALVPPAVERCGIDFVFSGHDHSYARTEPLRQGEVNKDSGVVYYICGSSGEKSYSITDNEDFHFAKLSGDYTGVYLSVNTTKSTMTVDTFEVDGSLLDSYTKTKVDPCAAGHKPMHCIDGSLRCSTCGQVLEGYTGFAVDEATGGQMYYLGGAYKTGWFTLVDEVLHFGTDGIRHEVSSSETPTTCTKQGATAYTCSCGETYVVNGQAPSGHEYAEQGDGSFVCEACGWKRIELSDCSISLPYENYTYTGSERRPYPVVVAPDGTRLEGGSVDFYVNWKNNVNVGWGTAVVTAKSGYLVNLTEYRGDYGGSVEVRFKIRPPRPSGLEVAEREPTALKLVWQGSEATDYYQIYRSSDEGASWKKVAETSERSCVVDELEPDAAYQFKVRAYTAVDDEKFYSLAYSDVVGARTAVLPSEDDYTLALSRSVYTYNGAERMPEVAVFTSDGQALAADSYRVRYEDNKNAGTARAIITVPTPYGDVEMVREFTIKTASLGSCSAMLSQEQYIYSGGLKKPAVTVKTAKGTRLAKNKNYTVEYLDNKNAGTATVVVKGTGNYSGTLTREFSIEKASLDACTAKLNFTKARYSGNEKRPGVTVVTAKGTRLAKNKNYTVEYADNVQPGTATVTVSGMGNYQGVIDLTFTIKQADLGACTVSLPYSTYYYTGEERTPKVIVKTPKGTRLAEGKNYEVEYVNNVQPGTATVTVKGVNNYTGSASTTFVIKNR